MNGDREEAYRKGHMSAEQAEAFEIDRANERRRRGVYTPKFNNLKPEGTYQMTNATQPIGRVMLRDARLAFPNLFEPTTVAGEGKPRYSATLLIPVDHPQLEEIKKKIDAIAKDKWREKAAGILSGLYKTGKVALHDGDEKAQYDGFPGNMFIAAASQESAPPTVVDQARNALTSKSGKPYAGCYVNASLEFWVQDNQWGKRVNCTLRGIQFLRDGDSFSAGRPADADEFDEVTEGAGAEDFA